MALCYLGQAMRGVVITVALHDGAILIPRGQLALQPGDRVQVLATPSGRETVLQQFGASS